MLTADASGAACESLFSGIISIYKGICLRDSNEKLHKTGSICDVPTRTEIAGQSQAARVRKAVVVTHLVAKRRFSYQSNPRRC